MRKFLLLPVVLFLMSGYVGIVCVNAQQAAEPWDARSSSQNAESEMREDEAMASTEMQGSVTGQVISVNGSLKALTIREDSLDSDIDTFYINRDTTFTVVSSLNEIKSGDRVTINYFVVNYNNIADSILLEERAPSEEAAQPISKVLVD